MPPDSDFGIVTLETVETDELDRLLGQLGPLGLRDVVQLSQQFDVALDRAPGEQCGVLEHVPEPIAIDDHATGRRFEQTRGDLQQCRLAAPGRADHGDELAFADGERHVADRLGTVREHHADVLERQ